MRAVELNIGEKGDEHKENDKLDLVLTAF